MLLLKAINKFKKHLVYKQSSQETIKRYMKEMKYLNNYLAKEMNGMVYIDSITNNELQDYLKEKIEKGLQPSSINQIIYVFRSFYNFLVKKGYVDENIAKGLDLLKTSNKERDYLTKEEFEELLKVMDHKIIKVAAITIFNTGLRISELINLKLDDVDLKGNILKVVSGKGNKDRSIPINDNLQKVLINYLENTRPIVSTDNFFATKSSGKVSRAYVNEILKESAKKAKINKKVTSHVLRHSFASFLLEKGVNLIDIQKLLGHSSLKTTAIYAHTNMKKLKKSVKVFT